jgi:uncharacterized protein YuzE
MKQRYLEVTFRKGKPFAAYLYLPRPTGARAARTIDAGSGVHIDVDEAGHPIGVEITAPSRLSVGDLNAILTRHGVGELDEREYAPLAA